MLQGVCVYVWQYSNSAFETKENSKLLLRLLFNTQPQHMHVHKSDDKHRHAKRARVIFLVIGVFVELFTVMIWLSFFLLGCDVQQEGNWKSIICKYNVTSVMVR